MLTYQVLFWIEGVSIGGSENALTMDLNANGLWIDGSGNQRPFSPVISIPYDQNTVTRTSLTGAIREAIVTFLETDQSASFAGYTVTIGGTDPFIQL